MEKFNKSMWTIFGFLLICIALIIVSIFVNSQVDGLTNDPIWPIAYIKSDQTSQNVRSAPSVDIILRIERELDQDGFAESIFLKNKEEIARWKTKDGKIVEMTGRIPDGKVKFVNETEKTYGFEHFKNGKRDGSFAEYYNNDQIKTEIQYRAGRMLGKKQFFLDGRVQLEVDYRNAHFISLSALKYAGVGKIYRSNGALLFEWEFEDDSERYFDKSYDFKGDLIEANYYDGQGNLVEHWEPSSEGAEN